MKAAPYLRVSTIEQNVDSQRPALEAYARSRGWQISGVYSENELAWKSGHQAELSRLLKELRTGQRKYDVVMIWALDRLSRLGPLTILTLVDSFKRAGCKVVSFQEPWTEIDGPINDVLYSLIAWVAKMESERRSERTKVGLVRVRSWGDQPAVRMPGSGGVPGTYCGMQINGS